MKEDTKKMQEFIDRLTGKAPTVVAVTTASPSAIPPDVRVDGCTCDAELNTAADIQKVFKQVQREYTRRWKFIEKAAKLLAKFGFKPGVNVVWDYNTKPTDGEYPLDWTVNEAVYLATGRGQLGDLSGGLQTGDWSAKTRPNVREAIKYIVTSPRVQPVKLTTAQTAHLAESFKEAYHAHLHLVEPMGRVYTFIHQKVGHICELPDKTQHEIYDFLWEFRHESDKDYGFGVNDLVGLLNNTQQELLTMANTSVAVN